MRTAYLLPLTIVLLLLSCSSEENTMEDPLVDNNSEQESNTGSNCPAAIGFVFEESNGIVSIEFENNEFPQGWVLKNDVSDVSGDGYMQWEGNPSMGDPGNGMVTFPIRISNTGVYRFNWKSSYRKGDNGTEHNDSWLRFPDADDFFGMKNDGSVVYPNGSGKQPNPNGASKDGWFKIYRSGDDNAFKWQARTSDHDAHDIYVSFETAGIYVLEVAARSDFHAIDRILLHRETIAENDAISLAANFSNKESCN